jgi:hypothetical protein
MSVWKEDAFMLKEIESVQGNIPINAVKGDAFYGPYSMARGFELDDLDCKQKKAVDKLRQFCKENREYAKETTDGSTWRYEMTLDEGTYGWNVKIEKRSGFLGLTITPFTREEA